MEFDDIITRLQTAYIERQERKAAATTRREVLFMRLINTVPWQRKFIDMPSKPAGRRN